MLDRLLCVRGMQCRGRGTRLWFQCIYVCMLYIMYENCAAMIVNNDIVYCLGEGWTCRAKEVDDVLFTGTHMSRGPLTYMRAHVAPTKASKLSCYNQRTQLSSITCHRHGTAITLTTTARSQSDLQLGQAGNWKVRRCHRRGHFLWTVRCVDVPRELVPLLTGS